ncbi:THAP-type domain-containing protein [Aphis craccivora]|uniref:THAP-type domain-containing protein n=1 Tax=Aphis craccivora TaxID=307492 RepID=A0A6G0Y1J6_APHCR|nr:THAP-type domain-containing protein [Aphis craccivora]
MKSQPFLFLIQNVAEATNSVADVCIERKNSNQKRKRYNPDAIGNLSPSHLNTPRKAKRNLEMQVKRLQAKLKTYNDLILQLKYKNCISENTSVYLQVKFLLDLNHCIL